MHSYRSTPKTLEEGVGAHYVTLFLMLHVNDRARSSAVCCHSILGLKEGVTGSLLSLVLLYLFSLFKTFPLVAQNNQLSYTKIRDIATVAHKFSTAY